MRAGNAFKSTLVGKQLGDDGRRTLVDKPLGDDGMPQRIADTRGGDIDKTEMAHMPEVLRSSHARRDF